MSAATAGASASTFGQSGSSPAATMGAISKTGGPENGTAQRTVDARKRPPPSALTASNVSAKRPNPGTSRPSAGDASRSANKSSSEVPACLERLVRSIVRMFYSREHSLIVDMLVRNTIMKENDLCERLRFEEKQLRQYLRTLKQDQFIKSRLQLETDADGKTTKITHYFIEYKLFVNVVKYRLDQMQRRLEAEQRQSTSRASFKCPSCHMTYTDLEVDRLLDLSNPGKLKCVYCQCEVAEEEDNVSRTDARALIAKFHHQVREPIDNMLRECDEVHLSSSILEPEIRPLEPLTDGLESDFKTGDPMRPSFDSGPLSDTGAKRNDTAFGPTESHVRIVLSGQADVGSQNAKVRPIWMADSTINSGPSAGLGDLDRGPGFAGSNSDFAGSTSGASSDQTMIGSVTGDSITQTLAPGRVPSGFSTASGGSASASSANRDGTDSQVSNSTGNSTSTSDIMQLLLVHERRRSTNQSSGKISHLVPKSTPSTKHSVQTTSSVTTDRPHGTKEDDSTDQNSTPSQFLVCLDGRMVPYAEITGAMIKAMTPQERAEYVRVGKQMYMDLMMQ